MDKITEFKQEVVKKAREAGNSEKDLTIKINKASIKTALGKQRLKKETLEKVKKEFKNSGIEVLEDCTSTLCVKIPKEKLDDSIFIYEDM